MIISTMHPKVFQAFTHVYEIFPLWQESTGDLLLQPFKVYDIFPRFQRIGQQVNFVQSLNRKNTPRVSTCTSLRFLIGYKLNVMRDSYRSIYLYFVQRITHTLLVKVPKQPNMPAWWLVPKITVVFIVIQVIVENNW